MLYREFPPSGAAASFVKCYWALEDFAPSQEVQRIVPDGRPELILNFGQPFQSFQQGRWQSQPEFFVAGQITSPLLLQPNGPARIIGVRFHPHGAGQLLRMPMPEFNDSVVSLEDISRPLMRQLDPMRELRSLPEQVAELDLILQRFAGEQDLRLSHAVRRFERTNGLFSIDAAANEIGLRRRQFERRFRQQTGISPKLFCRMQRFQQVFHATDAAEPDWADAAFHAGYYDQAHLIRDFREFVGKTPTALLNGEVDLARHFAGAVSHFSKTPTPAHQ